MNRRAYVVVCTLTFSLIAACGGKVIESGQGDDGGGAGASGTGATGGTTGDGGSGGTGYAGTSGTGYGGTGYAGTAGTGYGGTGYGGTGYGGTGYGGTGYAGTAGTGYGGTGYAGTAGTGYGGTGYGGTGYAGTAGTGYAGTAGFGGDCSSTPDCLQCCEVQNAYAMQLFYKLMAGCVCNPSECGSLCQDFCSQPLTFPVGPCEQCLMDSVTAGGCTSVISDCLSDPNCAPALQCLLTCP